MGGGQAATDAPVQRWCAWSRCERAATIEVLAGDLLRRRRRHHGYFCAPHSVETSRLMRTRAAVDVWFAVVGPERAERA